MFAWDKQLDVFPRVFMTKKRGLVTFTLQLKMVFLALYIAMIIIMIIFIFFFFPVVVVVAVVAVVVGVTDDIVVVFVVCRRLLLLLVYTAKFPQNG